MEWTKYTAKEALKDNDELMILDTDGKANKRTFVSEIWEYILGKLTSAVIEKLETTDKTAIGAINELQAQNEEKANGKGISFSINESGGLRVTYDDGK